jgi:hypothetical protein
MVSRHSACPSKSYELNKRRKILRGFQNLAGLANDNERFTN